MEGQFVLPFLFQSNMKKLLLFSFVTLSFGTVFAQNTSYWQQHVDYKMEVNLSDTLLLIKNDDVPGVIGKVGTLLGQNSINIGAYLLSQGNNDKLALGVIRLDSPLKKAIIDLLKDIEEIKYVKQIGTNN